MQMSNIKYCNYAKLHFIVFIYLYNKNIYNQSFYVIIYLINKRAVL